MLEKVEQPVADAARRRDSCARVEHLAGRCAQSQRLSPGSPLAALSRSATSPSSAPRATGARHGPAAGSPLVEVGWDGPDIERRRLYHTIYEYVEGSTVVSARERGCRASAAPRAAEIEPPAVEDARSARTRRSPNSSSSTARRGGGACAPRSRHEAYDDAGDDATGVALSARDLRAVHGRRRAGFAVVRPPKRTRGRAPRARGENRAHARGGIVNWRRLRPI